MHVSATACSCTWLHQMVAKSTCTSHCDHCQLVPLQSWLQLCLIETSCWLCCGGFWGTMYWSLGWTSSTVTAMFIGIHAWVFWSRMLALPWLLALHSEQTFIMWVACSPEQYWPCHPCGCVDWLKQWCVQEKVQVLIHILYRISFPATSYSCSCISDGWLTG